MPEPVPAPVPIPVKVVDPLPLEDLQVPQGVRIPKKLYEFFVAMTKSGASDLHLKIGNVPYARLNENLRKSTLPVITREEMQEMVDRLLNQEQLEEFKKIGSFDLAFQIPHGDRFRINIFRQRGNVSLVARRVTCKIPNFEQLHLPDSVNKITEFHQGLVLVVGPTGCGKTTTIASILNYINHTRACHIVTIEDPIEYVYDDDNALVNQREVGIDVPTFHEGIRSILREDPDIVLIGEMRDATTVEAAIQTAETGHLVFGTLHASSVPQAISRILDLFPKESRQLILQAMAYTMQAILCQRLLPCVKEDVPRVPACEVLFNNAVVRDKLEKGLDNELGDVIKSNQDDGMQTLTQSLYHLIKNNMIDPKDAYPIAPSAVELKMMLKGIVQSGAKR